MGGHADAAAMRGEGEKGSHVSASSWGQVVIRIELKRERAGAAAGAALIVSN